VSYSFYEVFTAAQRAFQGMGFPYGADEDAAFIIAWLELNNFQGITLLAKSINTLDKKYNGTIKVRNLNAQIDFQNNSILMKGPGLVDFIKSKIHDKEKISVKIINCKDGILFLPLLYKISKNLNSIKLTYFDSNNEIKNYQINNNEINIDQKKTQNLISKNQISIVINKNSKDFKNFIKKEIISEKIIQKNLSRSLTPEMNAWEKISKIADRTFVPESEESRNKGAGGGDDND
tara:strand:+ start:485 stop:1186 length:702 start_codon:yes stop_codon:yes gene_type:complete